MKKTDSETLDALREHAMNHPEQSYAQIAATFGLSIITVKRHCADLGRSKNRRKGQPSNGDFDPNRLWAQVDRKPGGECWKWRGCTNSAGYGFIYVRGKSLPVHQFAYELSKGPVPQGLELDHLCCNRTCCNPEHLEPVTHAENMVRAGIIPHAKPASIDTPTTDVDTVRSTDTTDSDDCQRADDSVLPHINAFGSKDQISDTSDRLIPVSIGSPLAPNSSQTTKAVTRVLVTPRPRRPDPFAPLCTMEEPPPLELVKGPERHEPPRGTKEDLGIEDWAVTEFGDFWWRQTDEELRNRSVHAQTQKMREDGEFLHWYRVAPLDPEEGGVFMAARTGPEACIKVERNRGKGWAHSWEYMRPDPHRGPFFYYSVMVLYEGHVARLMPIIARTATDAISMVESTWGPGYVLSCEQLPRLEIKCLEFWVNSWRRMLTEHKASVLKKCAEKPRLGLPPKI